MWLTSSSYSRKYGTQREPFYSDTRRRSEFAIVVTCRSAVQLRIHAKVGKPFPVMASTATLELTHEISVMARDKEPPKLAHEHWIRPCEVKEVVIS